MPGLTKVMLLVVLIGGGRLTLAQQMGFSIGPRPAFAASPRGSGLTISFHATPARFIHQQLLIPGFYDPSFFYPDTYQPVVSPTVSPSPAIIVLQPPQQEVRAEPKPPELLLLERRGTRFIRLRSSGVASDSANAEALNSASASDRRPAKLSEARSTVLVFHDGQREETVSYTIADGFLYEATDYWNTGTWTKRVSLSSLDLPATLRENQLRGVKFLLPSGPDEVMVH
jgi:hypothetical protein